MPVIDDNSRIKVLTTGQPRTCVWTGRTLPEETVALRFETRLFTDALERVWCSLDAVDALAAALRRSDPTNGGHAISLPAASDEHSILYVDEPLSRENACFCCDETITGPFYEFHAVGPTGQPSLVFCHRSCRQTLCDYLETVWNETDALLADAL